MYHLERGADRAVLLTQGVEAMWIGGHDAIERAAGQKLDVVLGQHLE